MFHLPEVVWMILLLFFIDAALSKMFHATSAINITRFPELKEDSNFISNGLIANFIFFSQLIVYIFLLGN